MVLYPTRHDKIDHGKENESTPRSCIWALSCRNFGLTFLALKSKKSVCNMIYDDDDDGCDVYYYYYYCCVVFNTVVAPPHAFSNEGEDKYVYY
jgi:hypothetical protein